MSTVRVGENENIDSALRRFKRKCSRDGIIGDLRRKEHYEKPFRKKKEKIGSGEKKKHERVKITCRILRQVFFFTIAKIKDLCRKREKVWQAKRKRSNSMRKRLNTE